MYLYHPKNLPLVIVGKFFSLDGVVHPLSDLEKVMQHNNYPVKTVLTLIKTVKQNNGMKTVWTSLAKHPDSMVRILVAYNKKQLRRLSDDKSVAVREAVAQTGYQSEKFLRDVSWQVRLAVAKQAKHLDLLANDKSEFVRAELVKQGYHPKEFIKDKSALVRSMIAKKDLSLSVLANDSDPNVRATVAKQGYGIEFLQHDRNDVVANIAKSQLLAKKTKPMQPIRQ